MVDLERVVIGGVLLGLATAVLELLAGDGAELLPQAGAAGAALVLLAVLGAATLVVLGLAAASRGLRALEGVSRRWSALALLAPTALAAAVLAEPVFAGHAAQRLPLVASYPWVLGGLAGLSVLLARRLAEDRPRAVGGLLLAAGVAGFLADALVLPGLYPAFHRLLALGYAGAAGAGLLLLLPRPAGARHPGLAGAAAVALLCGGILGCGRAASDLALTTATFRHSVVAWRVLRAFPAGAGAAPAAGVADDPTPAAHRMAARRHRELVEERHGGDRPSILLVTVDALRADRAPGSRRATRTMPAVTSWARDARVFTRAYAPTVMTFPSCRSIMTGRYPGTFTLGSLVEPPVPLPQRLKALGYETHFLAGITVLDPSDERWVSGLEGGFDVMEQALGVEEMAARVRALAEREGDRPWFAWVHPIEPHAPYLPPPEFRSGTDARSLYDGEVRHVDAVLGPLLEALPPDVWVVLTADHGEEFRDEHGFTSHGASLYEPGIHVPLVFRGPDVAPGVVRRPVTLTDLYPTLLGLAGVVDPPRADGLSLVPALHGDLVALRLRDAVFSERRYDNRLAALPSPERAMIGAREKVIVTDSPPALEVYDLERDPGERRNLLGSDPDRALEARRVFQARLAAVVARWSSPEGAGLAVRSASPEGLAELARRMERGPGLRREACRLLALRGDEEHRGAYEAMLLSGDPAVRAWGSVGLGRLAERGPWPLRHALRGPSDEARRVALELLCRRPRTEAIPHVLELARKRPPGRAWREIVILNALGHRAGFELTRELLRSPDCYGPGGYEVVHRLGGASLQGVPALLEEHLERLVADPVHAANLVHLAPQYPGRRMLRVLARIERLPEAPVETGTAPARRRVLEGIAREREVLGSTRTGGGWPSEAFPVAWEAVPGVSFAVPAEGALREGEWGPVHELLPVRPMPEGRATVRLPDGAPRGRLVLQAFLGAPARVVLELGAARETFEAKAGRRTLVWRLPPGAGGAFLHLSVEGLDPLLAGFRELALLP